MSKKQMNAFNEGFINRYAGLIDTDKQHKTLLESLDDEISRYVEVDSKLVPDSDGFVTDYTMYKDKDSDHYVFVFGDKDVYSPEDEDFDWECDSYDEAKEWFDSYGGFENLDEDVNNDITVTVEYYLNKACAQRRPETAEDIEDGYCIKQISGENLLHVWKQIFELVTGYEVDEYFEDYFDDEDAEITVEDIVKYFQDQDFGDGSPILCNVIGSDGDVIYDSGLSKQSLIDGLSDFDNVYDLFKDVSDETFYDYDGAVDYIESKGISCDPAYDNVGEYACDLLDAEKEPYSKSTLDNIVQQILNFCCKEGSCQHCDSMDTLSEDMVDNVVASKFDVITVNDDCVITSATNVMDAYQSANKWLDIVKEIVYTNLGCVFFSSYIHNLAHSMPVRFDKFGDILHTVNMLIPYPATDYIPSEPADIDQTFDSLFMVLDKIKKSLNEFIKCTDEPYHGMSCAAEALLNDIESEYPMLYRMKQDWANSNGDMATFDKYVGQYVKERENLTESILTEAPTFTNAEMNDPKSIDLKQIAKRDFDEKEAQRKAKEVADKRAELKSKYADVIDEISKAPNRMETAFELLVPSNGMAETEAGELVRAMMRILYRDYNDGDVFYEGYGLETVAPSMQYIANIVDDVDDDVFNIRNKMLDNDEYTKAINVIADKVIDYILNNPETFENAPKADSRTQDCSGMIENQPRYDLDISVDNDIVEEAVESGFIDSDRLADYVEDCLNGNYVFEGAYVERPWASDVTYVQVSDLTRDGYDLLEEYSKHGFWDQLADDLSEEGFDTESEEIDDEDDEEE